MKMVAQYRQVMIGLTGIMILAALCTPLMSCSSISQDIFFARYYWLFFTAVFSGCILWIPAICRPLRLTITDKLVALFLAYLYLQSIWLPDAIPANKKLLYFFASALVYFAVRIWISGTAADGRKPRLYVVAGLCFVAVVSCVVAWLQVAGYMQWYNRAFPVTGTFFHPAPLAGFAAMLCPIVFYYGYTILKYPSSADKRYGYLALGTGALLVITVLLAASRAAVAGLLGGVAFTWLTGNSHAVLAWLRKYIRWWLWLPVIAILLLIGFLSYNIRASSVNGRLLVWKVSWQMYKDRPLTGHGPDAFRYKYPDYQVQYFKSGSSRESERLLSDEVGSTYNEPLQIACELGIIGLLIYLAIIYTAIKSGRKTEPRHDGETVIRTGASGALVTWLIFSLFSYPLSLPELTVSFFIYLALCQPETAMYAHRRITVSVIWIPVLIAACTLLLFSEMKTMYRQLLAYRQWTAADKHLGLKEAVVVYRSLLPVLAHEDNFLSVYARLLSEQDLYSASNEILRHKKPYTYSDLMLMAENYTRLNDNEAAIAAYMKGHYLLPHKYLPPYRIMQLSKVKQPALASKMAALIIAMPVKILSDDVTDMKNAAKRWLKNNGDFSKEE
ncbi:O-antigen ligase family protein [Chitinophaga sp. Mgbs1]|uniref:O-antigen ligase family protein n=1 Tax=Chitinophaga solisilvae TaxID=1233460 RepID=A0A3S1JET4_9BACT|nr:O-antigen ligase family protein [Chitinophaga solisilvae]